MADAALRGRSVVITRPADQAAGLAELLEARGARVRVHPLVRIAPPADPDALARALRSLDGFDWVVFTSVNAVKACTGHGIARWPRVACVGSATAAAARDAGLGVDVVPGAFTAEGLAAAWPRESLAGARVLWPRASAAREVLAVALAEAGADVVQVEAYRTVEDQGAAAALHRSLRDDPADVLLFTSPSAVRAFAAVGPAPAGALVAVIGTVTETAALRAGLAVHIRPPEHTIAALAEAVSARLGRDAHVDHDGNHE